MKDETTPVTLRRFWKAARHEHGPGRTHVLDAEQENRTMCGKGVDQIGGFEVYSGFDCQGCMQGIAVREKRAQRKETKK